MMLLNSHKKPIQYDTDQGAFLLGHNTVYSIVVGNFHKTLKAIAEIEIDGVQVGRFQLRPDEVMEIERPAKVERKFTFVNKDSQLGKQGGLHEKMDSKLGRCKLVFRQEIPSMDVPVYRRTFTDGFHSVPDYCRTSTDGFHDVPDGYTRYGSHESEIVESDGTGGTVLGDESNQTFVRVTEVKTEKVCTCKFRMALWPAAVPLR